MHGATVEKNCIRYFRKMQEIETDGKK